MAAAPWHFLYFLPLPHGQGSFLPMVFMSLVFGSSLQNTIPLGHIPAARTGSIFNRMMKDMPKLNPRCSRACLSCFILGGGLELKCSSENRGCFAKTISILSVMGLTLTKEDIYTRSSSAAAASFLETEGVMFPRINEWATLSALGE
jgi:hypothetical protein